MDNNINTAIIEIKTINRTSVFYTMYEKTKYWIGVHILKL